jgi:hypothetical protein
VPDPEYLVLKKELYGLTEQKPLITGAETAHIVVLRDSPGVGEFRMDVNDPRIKSMFVAKAMK